VLDLATQREARPTVSVRPESTATDTRPAKTIGPELVVMD